MFKIFFLLTQLLSSLHLFAQQKTRHVNMLWFNYNNTIEVNKKWSVLNDVQLRTRDWLKLWSLVAVRSGIAYKLNEKYTVTAGFTWFGNVRYVQDIAVLTNEWRPWQEVSLQLHTGKGQLVQRIRTEQRFLQQLSGTSRTNKYENRLRFRYRIEYSFPPLSKKTTLHIGNEVMLNLNYINDSRFFDQNRIFALVNYTTTTSTFVQFQFIKILQWQAPVNILEDQNVFRCSVHHCISCKN